MVMYSPVEYAMEAISQAGTVMAVLTKEGVVMVAEKVRSYLSPKQQRETHVFRPGRRRK